jgi:hypothetical protein
MCVANNTPTSNRAVIRVLGRNVVQQHMTGSSILTGDLTPHEAAARVSQRAVVSSESLPWMLPTTLVFWKGGFAFRTQGVIVLGECANYQLRKKREKRCGGTKRSVQP